MLLSGFTRLALIFGAAVALFSGTGAASAIPISFTTTGVFSAGTPSQISYTPTSFSGTTAADGSLDLSDLGTFTASEVTSNVDFNGFLFTLGFQFTLPDGVSGTVQFVGDLHGQLHVNGGGGLQIHFSTNNPLLVNYSGANGSGSFNLTVDNIKGLDAGSPQTATGSVSSSGVVTTSAIPEPGMATLIGSALVAISVAMRRRKRS